MNVCFLDVDIKKGNTKDIKEDIVVMSPPSNKDNGSLFSHVLLLGDHFQSSLLIPGGVCLNCMICTSQRVNKFWKTRTKLTSNFSTCVQ